MTMARQFGGPMLIALVIIALQLARAEDSGPDGESEKEQEKVSPVSTAISVMLLGAIGFQMILFYMVNAPDADVKRYSWQVVSQTISIFCAVLMFQAFNGLVEEYIIGGEEAEASNPRWTIAVDISQMLIWLFLLQVVLAVTSGAVGEAPTGGLKTVELNVKSWSVLFSHIAGFATINAWGSLQQFIFQATPLTTLLALPIGCVGLCTIFFVFDCARTWVSTSDDGIIDEYEEKWSEETADAENDVMALSLSFLLVQSMRFHINGPGGLPNQEGIEKWARSVSHGPADWSELFMWGFSFVGISLIVLQVLERVQQKKKYPKIERLLDVLNNFCTFANAWSFFYASKWAVGSVKILAESHERAMLLVTLAIFLSVVSFGFIIVLDALRDRKVFGEGDTAEQAIEKVIVALGILVGFSWEQCFDVAVTVVSVANKTMPASATRLLMSFVLVLIVFPAWRIHILKTEQELLQETTEQGHKMKYLANLAEQQSKLFLEVDTSETVLDYCHLKLKSKRRLAHGKSHPQSHKSIKRHVLVTFKGIEATLRPDIHGHGSHHQEHHGHGHEHHHQHHSHHGHHHSQRHFSLTERLLDV